MKYVKAHQVLAEEIIEIIQKYTDSAHNQYRIV